MIEDKLERLEKAIMNQRRLKEKRFIKAVRDLALKLNLTNLTDRDLSSIRIKLSKLTNKFGLNNLSEFQSNMTTVERLSIESLARSLKIKVSTLNKGSLRDIRNEFYKQALLKNEQINKSTISNYKKLFTKRILGPVKSEAALKTVITETMGITSSQADALIVTEVQGYDNEITTHKANENGYFKWRYRGQKDKKNRPFCAKRVNKIFTDKQAKKWDNGTNFDAERYLGGPRCRHRKEYQIE